MVSSVPQLPRRARSRTGASRSRRRRPSWSVRSSRATRQLSESFEMLNKLTMSMLLKMALLCFDHLLIIPSTKSIMFHVFYMSSSSFRRPQLSFPALDLGFKVSSQDSTCPPMLEVELYFLQHPETDRTKKTKVQSIHSIYIYYSRCLYISLSINGIQYTFILYRRSERRRRRCRRAGS